MGRQIRQQLARRPPRRGVGQRALRVQVSAAWRRGRLPAVLPVLETALSPAAVLAIGCRLLGI